jgi:hypothetical protein
LLPPFGLLIIGFLFGWIGVGAATVAVLIIAGFWQQGAANTECSERGLSDSDVGTLYLRVPPPPPGIERWQPSQQQAALDASSAMQHRALAGRDALLDLARLDALALASPEEAFGPVLGSDWFQYIRALARELGLGSVTKAMGAHDRLRHSYAIATISLAPAIGSKGPGAGWRPGTWREAQQIIGSTEGKDKATALRMIRNAELRAWDAIEEGVVAGLIDPPAFSLPATNCLPEPEP